MKDAEILDLLAVDRPDLNDRYPSATEDKRQKRMEPTEHLRKFLCAYAEYEFAISELTRARLLGIDETDARSQIPDDIHSDVTWQARIEFENLDSETNEGEEQ